jgi:hypothetical protein
MKLSSKSAAVVLFCFIYAWGKAEFLLELPRDVKESPDLSVAMTAFYTSLASDDLEAARRFVAPPPANWHDPDQRIHDHLKARSGAKRFLFFSSGPGATSGKDQPAAYVVSGVFVDRDGVLFLQEDAKSKLRKNCTFSDVWVKLPTGWRVMDGSFFKLDLSAYLKQLSASGTP